MDISERNRLEKRKRVLLLAAIDMEQAIEAARAISSEVVRDESNLQLIHALETAVAVCYWRPFTDSSIGRLNSIADGPSESTGLRDLHGALQTMRDRVYAHTDKRSGRDADVKDHVNEEGVAGIAFTEGWWAFPQEWLPNVMALATQQRERFRAEALDLQRQLGN